MAKEKRGFLATLNSKGLENSVTETQASGMCASQGSTYLFIVAAHAGKLVVNEDGSQVIHLIPDKVELVPVEHEETVRRFQRSLYMERPEQIGQQTIDSISDVEPASSDVAQELAAATSDYAEPEGAPWGEQPSSEEGGEPAEQIEHSPDGPMVPGCPSPGCLDIEGHDGDHTVADETDDATRPNVVAFTHKG